MPTGISLLNCLNQCSVIELRAMARRQQLRLQSLLKPDIISQLERCILDKAGGSTCAADLSEAAQSALAALLDAGGEAPLVGLQARFGELRKSLPGAIDSKQPWSDGLASPLDELHIYGLLFRVTPAHTFGSMLGRSDALAVVPMEVLDRLRPADIVRPRIFRSCAAPAAPAGPARYLCQDLMLLVSSILNAPPNRFSGAGLARRDLLRLNAHLLAPDDISDLRTERAARRCLFLRSLAEAQGLLARRDGRLEQGPALLDWLSLPPHEQRRQVINTFMGQPYRYVVDDLPAIELVRSPATEIITQARAFLVSLLDEADLGEWYTVPSLVHAARARNNALLRAPGDSSEIRCRQTGRALTLRDWNLVEGAWIEALVAGPLYWLGLVEPGRSRKGDLISFRVLPDARDPAETDSKKIASAKDRTSGSDRPESDRSLAPVQVQDDLTTHVSEHTPLSRWFRIEGISELLERGSISRYRIARERVRQALQAGTSLDQILEDLGAGAPAAAVATIRGWANRFGQVRILSAAVMTAADPALMTELRAAAGVSACLGASLGGRAHTILPGREEELVAQLRARGEMPHVEPLCLQGNLPPAAWEEIHQALKMWKVLASKEGSRGPSDEVCLLAARLAGPDLASAPGHEAAVDSSQAQMALIEDVVRQKRVVTFHYDDPDARRTGTVVVSPRSLGQQGGVTSLQGYRKGGAGLEWFRLDRMQRVQTIRSRTGQRTAEDEPT